MTMITPSYLGETIEYSSLHACRSTLEDPTPKGQQGFVAEFSAFLALGWLLALCLIKAQVINYLLCLEAALCLCWGLLLDGQDDALGGWLIACLAFLSLISARRLVPFEIMLLFSTFASAVFFWQRHVTVAGQSHDEFPQGAPAGAAKSRSFPVFTAWALSAILLLLLGHSALRYLRHADDPSRQVADLLLSHPARQKGETLWVLGEKTQAIAFYSRYTIRQLQAIPAHRPPEAILVNTLGGWEYYPPSFRK